MLGTPAPEVNDRSILVIFEHKINNNWKLTAQLAYFNYQQEGSSMWVVGFDSVNENLVQRTNSMWDVLGNKPAPKIFCLLQ